MSEIVAFEGMAGAGKTTTARVIRRFSLKRGCKVLLVNEKELEPFRTWVIKWHGRPLDQKLFNLEDVTSLARARSIAHRNIQRRFAEYDLVIFDRCVFTSAVYQQSPQVPWDKILEINFEQGVVVPETVFLFLGDPSICYRRVVERSKQRSSYKLPATTETKEQLQTHRNAYLAMLDVIPGLIMLDVCLPTARKAKIILAVLHML